MPPEPEPYAGNVFARRLREVREGRGWSQTELAERLEDYGRPFHRTTIGKLETPGHTRARNVPLEDVLAISAVLGVAPVHLFIPLDNAERVQVTRDLETDARTAREWVRGRGMIRDTSWRLFRSEQPEHEKRAMVDQSAAVDLPGTRPIGLEDLEPKPEELRDEQEGERR